jgi:hypothetical protein
MTQSHPLRDMSRTGAPDQSIFEILLQSPMDLVADVLDCRVAADDEGVVEVGVDAFSV